jgi:hypothetical protein
LRRVLLLVVSAPFFWITVGILQAVDVIVEGFGEWADLMGIEDEVDEEEK